MKEFFKMMLASMLGFLVTSIILIFLLVVILASLISIGSSEEVTIPSKSILQIKLDKPIVDRAPKNPIFYDFSSMSRQAGLTDILKNIHKAKNDNKITGILLDLETIQAGISTIDEIREALIDFKKSGKFIYSYSEGYSQSSYYLSTVSDRIYLNPEGEVVLKGINAELFFLKGLMDKIDVKMQIIRHGKFKAATEPFFMDKMSPENRTQIMTLITGIWNRMLDGISGTRQISKETLNRYADSLKIQTAGDALHYKLVDQLVYRDELIKELKKKIAIPEKEKISFITIEKYINVPEKETDKKTGKDKIAVIYATGDISGGDGDDRTIGSDRLSKAIRKAREDEKVKAIVLRVNSPGGSALASDVIWREVNLATQSKPVVVSMGNVAASGGYYISCAATRIIANPTTITGSIGVFGIIPNMKGLFNNKLGITFDNARTNPNAGFISVTEPLPPYQTRVLQNAIEHIYETFITKVAAGRHINKEIVDSIGQGRVWSATDGKKIGLVDDFGGLEKSIETAATLAKIKNYGITSLPEQKDFFEQLMEEFFGNSKVVPLEKILGDDYIYYQYLKQVREMKGVQARMPFEIILQ